MRVRQRLNNFGQGLDCLEKSTFLKKTPYKLSMKGCLLSIFVCFAFYFGLSAPLYKVLLGPAPPEVEQHKVMSSKVSDRSQLSKEELKMLEKLRTVRMEYYEKGRALMGTIPLVTFPTSLILTFLLLKKKKI